MSSLQEMVYWNVGYDWNIRHTAIEIFRKEDDGTVSVRSVGGMDYTIKGDDAEAFIKLMGL
jgi:hypothetical protein